MKYRLDLFRHASPVALSAAVILCAGAAANRGDGGDDELQLEFAHIFFEYNASDGDLGVHVFLDGEDWKKMKITKPDGSKLFEVKGQSGYAQLGMTELFFEGAEPDLDEFPLEDLLALFPEGEYEFEGVTVDREEIEGESDLSHAIPAAPVVHVETGGNDFLRISWDPVSGPPPGFPDREIHVVAYQVLVGEDFDVTLPRTARSVTIPPEFVASLSAGEHELEVLAIEQSGNQSITETKLTR